MKVMRSTERWTGSKELVDAERRGNGNNAFAAIFTAVNNKLSRYYFAHCADGYSALTETVGETMEFRKGR